MYKLIAIDMDGTLLRSDHTVSQYTKDVLKRVHKDGSRIVITTGRPIQGVQDYIKELGFFTDDDFIICNNGASIYSVKDFTPIYTNFMDKKYCEDLFKLGLEIGVTVEAFNPSYCISSDEFSYFRTAEEVAMPMETRISKTPEDFINHGDMFKIMFVADEDKLNEAIKLVPKFYYEKFNLVHSLPQIFEFLNKDCSKGQALVKLCEIVNIDLKDIVSFGDAPNDADMITNAGTGVAMGNGYESIKKIADFVTDTNDNDGVAKFLDK